MKTNPESGTVIYMQSGWPNLAVLVSPVRTSVMVGPQAGRYIPEAEIIRAAHDGKFIAETKFFHCGSANEVCSWLPCV